MESLIKPNKSHIRVNKHKRFWIRPLKGKPADHVLKNGCRQLQGQDVYYWISSGTLIGLYRDGKQIEFDTDIDVNVLYDISDNPQITLEGFEPILTTMYLDYPMQTAFMNNEVIFDIYYFYKGVKDGVVINYNMEGIIEKPLRFIEKLENLTHEGIEYPIPSDTENFLVWRFGDDWRIPKTSKVPWQEEATHLKRWS